jgi:hypothetical protein
VAVALVVWISLPWYSLLFPKTILSSHSYGASG